VVQPGHVLRADQRTPRRRKGPAQGHVDGQCRQPGQTEPGAGGRLQGRFDEAETIASQELSPEEAAANIAYLKAMLSEQDNWQRLRSGPNAARPG